MIWHTHVIALVPPGSLPELSRATSVAFVRAPEKGTEESVAGEEVQASLASALHAKGVNGQGVKVAIIDGGFLGLSSLQSSGDIPANVTTGDFCGGRFSFATEHGTAVTEIVHEMAPAAQLYLACTNDEASVLDAERWAKAKGVRIISFSVGYFADRGDGSGIVGSAAADARANGILWVSAAGNQAQQHWSGTFTDANGNGYEDFAPGDETNSFVLDSGEGACGELKWDEWPFAKSDFDLALYSDKNQLLVQSTNVQNGSQPPVEEACYQNNTGGLQTVGWMIFGAHVISTPRIDLFMIGNVEPLQYQTAGSIVDPASSPAALAVGAVCWQNSVLEFYSSQGPTIDGRIKPDIAAQDSVSSGTYGPFVGSCPSGFSGTSASAPTVAGAAALIAQANPSFKAAQLQAFLQQRAVVDIGAPGVDDQSGAGALRLPTTLTAPDQTRPTSRALPSKGKRGHVVKLLSRLFDNSGRVKLRDQVKRNGHVIKTYTTAFMSTPSPETGFVNWPAPAGIKGTITHCVRAQDRAGNVSAVTCAKVTLSG